MAALFEMSPTAGLMAVISATLQLTERNFEDYVSKN